MPKTNRDDGHTNPLIQNHPDDTLQYAVAVLHCLQHLNLRDGLDDEAELGVNLVLETVRIALRMQVNKSLSPKPRRNP